jgi:outer membrane lipoprotein SlyB
VRNLGKKRKLNMKSLLLTAAFLGLTLITSGCTRSLAGDSYSREEAQRPITYREATVLEVRKVRLQGTNSGLGVATGAALGGVAGSGMGAGRGSIVTAVVGAVAGGIVGAVAEEGYTREEAWELTLRTSTGENMVIVQEIGKSDKFEPGDHVRILQTNGKTRVSPAPASTPVDTGKSK